MLRRTEIAGNPKSIFPSLKFKSETLADGVFLYLRDLLKANVAKRGGVAKKAKPAAVGDT